MASTEVSDRRPRLNVFALSTECAGTFLACKEVSSHTSHVVPLTASRARRSRTLWPTMTWAEKVAWLVALAVIVTATVLSLVGHGFAVRIANSIVPIALLTAVVVTWRTGKRAQ